ncbi:hypothetical protein LEM8419_00207 [Neolewinella maritima]|uniref:PNPLA domain-containing protein n=1 Tax=Neolewinella maritima TaxID=1383882 RepID=A0ABN8EZN7_9BACT|nr:patatin-like phospholipase family protein [Neolewinella maritima]CAH0998901.1 hypothetical protein LEM8419_00207 [Neolewinella maritima]
MPTQAYEEEVFDLVEDLRAYRTTRGAAFRYSDIYDATGLQYVNLVQEGGGILGIALLGFTYVLEELGLRFLSLGGTSAGSINTLLMADLGTPDEPKSLRILERVAGKQFMDFVDGGYDAEQLTLLIQAMREGQSALSILSKGPEVFAALGNLPELFDRYGINPGRHFEDWLRSVLQHDDWYGLQENLRRLPDNLYQLSDYGDRRYPVGVQELDPRLAILAADITTQTKVEFPRMAGLYYDKPLERHPAEFVRASMSIPFFFEPKSIPLGWRAGREEEVRRQWRKLAGYRGTLPDEVLLVDGGIMSNFPIDVFHRADTIPQRPTIGVKLGEDRASSQTITQLTGFAGGIAEGMRNLRDFEFIRNNPEYRALVEYIDVEGFNWLDFAISEQDKLRLFRRGAEAASRFLRRFDWLEYKQGIKANLLRRIKPLVWELSDLRDLSETLEVLGIRDDKELEARIRHMQERDVPYNILWIDDAFTYALPLAILDRLHTRSDTVRSSDEALRQLDVRNKGDGRPSGRIDLIISDLTRREDSGNDSLRGLDFAALLAQDPDWRDIPVLIYAHTREGLREQYGRALPPNVVNTPGRDTVRHPHLVQEVVDALGRFGDFG